VHLVVEAGGVSRRRKFAVDPIMFGAPADMTTAAEAAFARAESKGCT
jgi:hypothetical protein